MTLGHAHPARRRLGSIARALAMLGWLALPAVAGGGAGVGAGGGDPRVPPGRDPGGVPVAIIGPGVDYRAPEIAQRLARDGEGELIGWDFADNDLRPFEAPSEAPSPVRVLLGEAGASKLIVLRTRDGDRGALAAAIGFAAKSPARIVPTLAGGGAVAAGGDPRTGSGPDWTLLIEAARRFSNLLFVVPAYGPPIAVPGFDDLAIPNLLLVAPVSRTGEALRGPDATAPLADIAAAIDMPPSGTMGGGTIAGARPLADVAVARIAALAARLAAVDPLLDAHGLKRRILSLAQPLPTMPRDAATGTTSQKNATAPIARSGWIAEPRRHFWLE